MQCLVIISMLFVLSMSGCQPWHRTAPASPAQVPADKPAKQEQRPSASRAPYESSAKQVEATSPQRRSRGPERAARITDNIVLGKVKEKLLETDLYDLYGKPFEGSSCFQGFSASMILVFKVDAEFVIKDDATYAERFEKEILPILKAGCGSLKEAHIDHFIKGVRLDQSLHEHSEDESAPGFGQPVSQMKITINPQGKLTYKMHSHESLAALRAFRDARLKPFGEDEENLNKRRKQVEDAVARQRAAEEAAEEKLAATNTTADGQLSLSGIDNEHKRLFLMIYDGEFIALSERKDIQDLPIILYRNAMSRYDKSCHQFFSDRVAVEESVDVFDHQEWNPFTRTRTTVTKQIKDTSYMERRYEQVFRSTFGKNIVTALKHSQKDVDERVTRRPGLWDNILKKGAVMMEEAAKEKERIEKGNASLDLLLSAAACGKPGIVRFMDNINRYVAHDFPSEVNAQPVNGTYPYTQDDSDYVGYQMIQRFYKHVPRGTFSPEFPTLPPQKEFFIWLNKDDDKTLGLRTVKMTRPTLWDLVPDRINTPTTFPPDVREAIAEKKYVVVTCGYIVKGGGEAPFSYWSANGPVPPESVQAFAKKHISAPRMSCPNKPE